MTLKLRSLWKVVLFYGFLTNRQPQIKVESRVVERRTDLTEFHLGQGMAQRPSFCTAGFWTTLLQSGSLPNLPRFGCRTRSL